MRRSDQGRVFGGGVAARLHDLLALCDQASHRLALLGRHRHSDVREDTLEPLDMAARLLQVRLERLAKLVRVGCSCPVMPVRTRRRSLPGNIADVAAMRRNGADALWWQSAVVYQIYPRSFLDSEGDGIGDLAGITSKLDYVAALGVDAIWLSPIYRSPMADFGYDVSDHTDIDPVFGDLAAFDVLLAEAHRRGLRVLLDRGVDGFRADVVHLIGKDEALPDQPAEIADLDIVGSHEHPRTHELLRGIRRVLDDYDGDRVIVGEVPILSAARLVPYYGHGDELHMVFNFILMHLPWEAEAFAATVAEAEELLSPSNAWPCWVLSNHDQPRHRTRYGASEARARAAALVLLTLRGTPVLYAGEELGLLDAEVPPARQLDPGGRDGSRAPLPWDSTPAHGWPAPPWLPWPPEPGLRNGQTQEADPDSILSLYRRLLQLRRHS